MAKPLLFYPGFVTFIAVSLTLILGVITPSSSIATNLYTPPKTGSLLAVIRFSPTPKLSIFASCSNKDVIEYSSKEFVAQILQSG